MPLEVWDGSAVQRRQMCVPKEGVSGCDLMPFLHTELVLPDGRIDKVLACSTVLSLYMFAQSYNASISQFHTFSTFSLFFPHRC
jgi:hypothetical protein